MSSARRPNNRRALTRYFGTLAISGLRNLGEGCADLGLFRRWHPFGLDGRHTGLADTAQQRFAKVNVFDGRGGVVVQAATYRFRMRPAAHHMGSTQPHELTARIGHLQQRADPLKLRLRNVRLRCLKLRYLRSLLSCLGLRRTGEKGGGDDRD